MSTQTVATTSTTSDRWGAVLRGAWRQLVIDLRVQLFSPMLISWLIMPTIGLLVVYFLRDSDVMGGEVSLAQLGIPGLLAMTVVTSGLIGIAGQLITERDDGTLLRAKAVPGGMPSRLIGDVVVNIGTALGPMLVLLGLAGFLVPDIWPSSPAAWFTLLWVSIVGLFATLPFGAVFGAMLRSPALLWTTALGTYGLLAISGIFYPLQALPGWVQTIAQVLPVYWTGLGLRSALLPDAAVALEVGQSWRTLETLGMLGLWTAVGLALAPIALRRMARRQSGSAVAAARERVLNQGY